jgi:hypothetical protein
VKRLFAAGNVAPLSAERKTPTPLTAAYTFVFAPGFWVSRSMSVMYCPFAPPTATSVNVLPELVERKRPVFVATSSVFAAGITILLMPRPFSVVPPTCDHVAPASIER